MNKFYLLLLYFLIVTNCIGQKKATGLAITFEVICKGENNILEKNLLNDFNESYSITKLKFYVSNIKFESKAKINLGKKVYLIDASKNNFISLKFPPKNITGISFLLGVDSILNCSGAQSGALDPLNDMFWTWNNGYIFFKLEGKADTSKADLHRIEHHIGGFKGTNKTMRKIYLPINNKALLKDKILVVQLDIDKYWNGMNRLKIAEQPVITVPGAQAKNAADNFSNMFSIKGNK